MNRIIKYNSMPLYMKKEGKWFKYNHVETTVNELGYYVNIYSVYEEITNEGLIKALEKDEEEYL